MGSLQTPPDAGSIWGRLPRAVEPFFRQFSPKQGYDVHICIDILVEGLYHGWYF